jgi:hypothetical protein
MRTLVLFVTVIIGHFFFWHCKAELLSVDFCERYAVILEEYLANCGDFAKDLRTQYNAVQKLIRVAELVKEWRDVHKVASCFANVAVFVVHSAS